MILRKKALLGATLAFLALSFAQAQEVKIGIAKIVQHVALDSAEQGVIDVLNEYAKNEGVTVTFDQQNANGDVNTASQIATKFKGEKVDVAVGIATPIAVSLANTLKDTPVVFSSVTDPVGARLVDDVKSGKGNVTGMSDAIPTVQHIALFKEIAGIKRLGYIYTSNEANSISALALVKEGCEKYGIKLVTQAISNSSEVRQAAEAIVRRVDGLYLSTDNTIFSALPAVKKVFNKAKKPIFSGDVTGAMSGGIFMASGFNYYKAGRATGELVVRILKGEKPENIPVRFMTDASDSDLLFDLDAAKAAKITIPAIYLQSANMIFEGGKLTKK
jgi:putative ABC transport system substrate-binding protein